MNREPLYDLHVHSTASDGALTYLQLVELARRSALAGFALTDHDALPNRAVVESAADQDVKIVMGVELSTWMEGTTGRRGCHLLALGVDPADPALSARCAEIRRIRRRRLIDLAERAVAAGARFDPGKIASYPADVSLGRLHLARELVKSGVEPNVRAAFARRLAPLGGENPWSPLALVDAIELAHRAGGVAVVAHPPARWEFEDFRCWTKLGVDGWEARFPGAAPPRSRLLTDWAEQLGAIATAGTDYHGDDLRRHLGQFTVRRQVVDQIESAPGRFETPPSAAPQAPAACPAC